jgi:DNA-binding HxlR family transcriptional regulator
MKWRDVGSEVCSVARTLSVVGEPWTLLVLREAFLQTRRFDDFQRRLGASRALVADRLEKLVQHGILERRGYQERPLRHEYRLTRKGLDLYPLIASLAAWGDRWMDGGKGRPVELVHRDCGRVTTAVLTCSECGERLDPRHVQSRPGPALGGPDAMPAGAIPRRTGSRRGR